jgi:tRNA pseudouridine55 synthase
MTERKVYEGVLRLGQTSDTDDTDGRPLAKSHAREAGTVEESEVRAALQRFTGKFEQEVPTYSAVKVKGKPLYHWARKGVPVDRPRKMVEVHAMELLSFQSPDVRFRVECSKGFYVRSLARDVGEQLGVGGVLAELRRDAIGAFQRTNAYPWQDRSELLPDLFERSFIPIEQLPD